MQQVFTHLLARFSIDGIRYTFMIFIFNCSFSGITKFEQLLYLKVLLELTCYRRINIDSGVY